MTTRQSASRGLLAAAAQPASLLKASPVPFYAQIRDALRKQILDGALASHQRLPSENQMIEMFGVSRITVRQALQELESEGLIVRVHGKGTFVAKPIAFQNLATLQGFGEAMHPHGFDTRSDLVSVREIPAEGLVAERLQSRPGAACVEIRRIRYLNQEPVSVETSYFLMAVGGRLAREDLSTKDILVILESSYGIALGRANLVLGAHQANQEQARQLGVATGFPLLHIERLTHDRAGLPLMYEHLFHRGDSFRYTVQVDRQTRGDAA
ncbi:GntR family transcriptional regulator [Paracandidimonas soli]|uniref:GntR family transcriptional regulator n=1 Tax=Paracandidimonas soli TaxID=1917182 RepID=A0A4R3UW31_9BURK|nr:GntR family transcriptional regulator [Paracandidimonas soli]TCU95191.1 GntR family transcriptional regulator [Paracandidimonas soli]